jgi:hypothetical protein
MRYISLPKIKVSAVMPNSEFLSKKTTFLRLKNGTTDFSYFAH